MANLLENGGFHGNLDEWTATGAILRSDGYPRDGCAQLDAGETVSQAVDIPEDQPYTLHYFYKPSTGATLTASYDTVSQAHSGDTADVWHEGVLLFALDVAASESVLFTAADAACLVDSVTLMVGMLPVSRGEIAAVVARRIAALATEQSLSTAASASGPEGDYSDAIDDALRSVGAVNRYGDPDVTRVPAGQVQSVIAAATTAMLERLRYTYSLESDVTLGPRTESRSQIAKLLGDLQSGSSGGGPVEIRKLIHPLFD